MSDAAEGDCDSLLILHGTRAMLDVQVEIEDIGPKGLPRDAAEEVEIGFIGKRYEAAQQVAVLCLARRDQASRVVVLFRDYPDGGAGDSGQEAEREEGDGSERELFVH